MHLAPCRFVFVMLAFVGLILNAFSHSKLWAETSAADSVHRDWHASWVTHPSIALREPVVLRFRTLLDLATVPDNYPVRVSADNRFVLYVNGQRVGDGPARGDLAHWRYERFELAPYLHMGKNLVTATVWNLGIFAPVAQISDRTAFLLESESGGQEGISTPGNWQVEIEPGHKPLDRSSVDFRTYMASGPGEEINAALYDWNWQSRGIDDKAWVAVASPMRDSIHADVNHAHSADTTGDNNWNLVPDLLPHMEYTETSAGSLVRIDSYDKGAAAPSHHEWTEFPAKPLVLTGGTRIHLLLDRKTLTTAYPKLTISGGKGSKIWITYAEALFDKEMHKGDRDEVADRQARGLKDKFLPDGGQHRIFEPLWWRTWRYIDLDIETAGEPLTLESLSASFTAYPFAEKASFHSSDAELKQIWDISWRTARLDAHETYMDTPYYEQLQYIGDTRIQALISYTVAGDDRLGRQAIEAFDASRFPDGITRSRYPSSLAQTIPPFSLIWIGMLRDWWEYRPDPAPARDSLPGARAVLDWFSRYEQPDGLLRKLPWWSFIDWVPKGTMPTYDAHGESCVTTLQYLGALEDAAALEQGIGDPVFAARDLERANHVRDGLQTHCWDRGRGLIAETPDKSSFSQQANMLGVLFDVTPKDRQREVLEKVLLINPDSDDANMMSASYYFRFYLARALHHAGMEDRYLSSLAPWRKLLALHFSTWPETPGDTRSDSHAWSSHPLYDMLTLLAGIEPASPGFRTVRIAPHLGYLRSLAASYPHPLGTIHVEYNHEGSEFDADITLPPGLTGVFAFRGKEQPLASGKNRIHVY